jgi:hypothetical protein
MKVIMPKSKAENQKLQPQISLIHTNFSSVFFEQVAAVLVQGLCSNSIEICQTYTK